MQGDQPTCFASEGAAAGAWRSLLARRFTPLIHEAFKTMVSDSVTYDNIWIPNHMKCITKSMGVIDFVFEVRVEIWIDVSMYLRQHNTYARHEE